MALHQYIGARYVPYYYENSLDPTSTEWEPNVHYEALTVVTLPNNHSYISKKDVPDNIGSPALNAAYWLDTGSYDAYIQNLQDQIDIINNTDLPAVNGRVDADELRLDALEEWVDVCCAVRKESDGTWTIISDANHEPKHVSGVQVNAQGRLEILFDDTYDKVGYGSIFPDETYAVQKISAGASVSNDRAVIYMTQRPLGGFFYFNGQTVTYDANLKGDIDSVDWYSAGGVSGFKVHFAYYAQCNRTIAASYSLLNRSGLSSTLQFRTSLLGGSGEQADVILVPNETITGVNSGAFIQIVKQPEVLASDIAYASTANFWFCAKVKKA